MTTADLLRALAASVAPVRQLTAVVPDARAAITAFVRVAHAGACPRCGGATWTPQAPHHLDCARCGRLSIYRGTPLQRRRTPALVLLAAVFGVFVDTATPSARGFARAHDVRLASAWALLHLVRDALPRPPLPPSARIYPLLGAGSAANAAAVAVGVVDGRVSAVRVVVSGPAQPARRLRRPQVAAVPPEAPIVWGTLRAWMTATFRGVSRAWLPNYLAEFVARLGRAAVRAAAVG